jgi:hypothetical protein
MHSKQQQFFVVGPIAIALTFACAAPQDGFVTREAVSRASTLSNDTYRGLKFVSGPAQTTRIFGGLYVTARLVRVVSGSDITDRLEVTSNSSDWIFLESASDSDQRSLRLERVDSDVRSMGRVTEIAFAMLPDGYTVDHQFRGIDVRVYGKRGALPVRLSNQYVTGFLDACYQHGAGVRAAVVPADVPAVPSAVSETTEKE